MAAAGRRIEVLHNHLDPHAPNSDGSDGSGVATLSQHSTAVATAVTAAQGSPLPQGPPVLIGGMVMDLQAHPSGPADVQRGGSVPGRVTQSAGGVARNVAEALALLVKSSHNPQLQAPLLVSAVGDDLAGRALLQHWQSVGLSTALVAQLPGGATPTVSVVFDLGGEVAACVADVALLERQLAPPLLQAPAVAAALAAARVLMLDGNLSEAALQEACRQAAAAGVPVWFEPVSVPKSVRATSLLRGLSYVSPNEKELAAMAAAARRLRHEQQHSEQQQQAEQQQQQCAGCCSRRAGCYQGCSESAAASAGQLVTAAGLPGSVAASLRSMLPDVATLLEEGVRHVVLTLGADGAALCTLSPDQQAVQVCHVPALPAKVVNCSGAGDCLVAGCLFGLAQGLTATASLAHGVATAKAAVQSQTNVPAGLDAAAVTRGAAEALAASTTFHLPLTHGLCCCTDSCKCRCCC